jgi:hypothetical protein
MVIETLKSPDEIIQSYGVREIYRKRYGKELLEVVITKEDNKAIIITQSFLEN